jgi:CRP/FNR family transcriptional regulator, cyclic AMP receptor protein
VRLRRNQKVDLIAHVPLFAQCSNRELEQIASIADEIDLEEGKELTHEGAAGREFFVLLEGSAEVKQDGETINTLGAGDFFGEIALISDRPRTATVVTTGPVRALVVTARDFRRLVDDSPEIETKVTAAAAERLNE